MRDALLIASALRSSRRSREQTLGVQRNAALQEPLSCPGSAEAVVNFYDERFNIGFSACEKADLVAFLRAL